VPTVTVTATDWLYVIVQAPETDAEIMGQHDAATDVRFIPAFKNKENAQQGLLQLSTTRGAKYEIQAMIVEDLKRHASEKGFLVFVLGADGRIEEQILPLEDPPSP
jgi:hypothetical protein